MKLTHIKAGSVRIADRGKAYIHIVLCLTLAWAFTIQASAQDADGKHLLWEVRSESNTVYLLGSMHMLTEDVYPLPSAMEQAFENSEALVLELDLDSLETSSLAGMLLNKALLPEGTTLRQVLPKETFDLAKTRLEMKGVQISTLDKMQPWFITVMLWTLELQDAGLSGEQGVDMYFHQKAVEEGKEVSGLESFAFQLNMLTGQTLEEQTTVLHEVLTKGSMEEGGIERLVEAWSTGDIDALEDYLLSE